MAAPLRKSGSVRVGTMAHGLIMSRDTIDGIVGAITEGITEDIMVEDIMAVITVEGITAADIMVADITTKNPDRLQIFLCRHGETEWTLTGQHTSFSEVSLTENGRKQAIMLGKRLQGIVFHKVIVSPMLRAQETCQLAGFDHRKTIEPSAMEWNYGEYEGITTPQIWEKHARWNIFDDGAPGGESPDEVAERADRLLKSFIHESGNILIFSHGHFSRVFAARWLGLQAEDGKLFSLSVASVSILAMEHDQRVIKLWNETAQR